MFTKPIREIEWNDIEEFCQQQIPEGPFLDYKQSIPDNLENTIAAMANTLGGIIIIGIEDNDSKPKIPIKGIDYDRGLSEKITNIILSRMTPPVFPEIRVAQKENKAILVLGIPQSHQTPHAVAKNTRVYIRTGNVNTPEELSTIDNIQWLVNQRKESVNLREKLFNQMEERYLTFLERAAKRPDNLNTKKLSTGILTISASPLYPRSYFMSPPELKEMRVKIRVQDYFDGGQFPYENRSEIGGILQDGYNSIIYSGDPLRIFYTEFNSLGIYFFRQHLKREILTINNSEIENLEAGEILATLDIFIDSASLFYKELGYWGGLNIKISLESIKNLTISTALTPKSQPYSKRSQCPDNEVSYNVTMLTGKIKTEKRQLIQDCAKKIFWAFGADIPDSNITEFFAQYTR